MREPLAPVSLDEIVAAQNRIAEHVIRTPLIPLDVASAPASIYLKLESLQPIGSFKLRGAANAMTLVDPDELAGGVWTASAGNWAQGMAWHAQRMNIPCQIVVPDYAPKTKLRAIREFGAEIIQVPFAQWWEAIRTGTFDGLSSYFIHPVSDPRVIAGNGTIGLEIIEDLPGVSAIVVPFGGGGLSCGIACAVRGMERQWSIPVHAAEVETAAPFAASLAQDRPATIEHTPSFVDGIGGRSVLPEMWPLAKEVLAGSLVVTIDQVAQTIRLLIEHAHVIAEGAGAASVAAALAGQAGTSEEKIVCVVSGGNIDHSTLASILQGQTP